MAHKRYERETLAMIRAENERLAAMKDAKLKNLYHVWSEETACAGWLSPSPNGIKEFCAWALVPNCWKV